MLKSAGVKHVYINFPLEWYDTLKKNFVFCLHNYYVSFQFQEIDSIYEHFAELENIEKSFISLELHNKQLSPSDTPDSISYKIVDFIGMVCILNN